MSQGNACKNRTEHFSRWVVRVLKANYSAFNGYHRTLSDYSEVWCPACPASWRTKAAYVDRLPVVPWGDDEPESEAT